MAKKEIAVKKYVVQLSAEERERLEALIYTGKSSARMLTRARILLKADVSEAGEGWSDSTISAALDTSVNNVARTRQQLVEEGFEATLSRKYNPNSARPRIFDGAAEAKLIALACSPAPEGGSLVGPCVSSKRRVGLAQAVVQYQRLGRSRSGFPERFPRRKDSIFPIAGQCISIGQTGIGLGVVWIDFDRVAKIGDGSLQAVSGSFVPCLSG